MERPLRTMSLFNPPCELVDRVIELILLDSKSHDYGIVKSEISFMLATSRCQNIDAVHCNPDVVAAVAVAKLLRPTDDESTEELNQESTSTSGGQAAAESTATSGDHVNVKSPEEQLIDCLVELQMSFDPATTKSSEEKFLALVAAHRARVKALRTGPGTGFQLFPGLPFELRKKIWIAALPEGRILRIDPHLMLPSDGESPTDGHMDRPDRYDVCFDTADPNIAMLGACWESRRIAVKAYPIHLRSLSSFRDREIRVGADDYVVMDSGVEFLAMMKEIMNDYGREIISAAEAGLRAAWGPKEPPPRITGIPRIDELIRARPLTFYNGFKQLRKINKLAILANVPDKHDRHLIGSLNHAKLDMNAIRRFFHTFQHLFPLVKTVTIVCDKGSEATATRNVEDFVTVGDDDWAEHVAKDDLVLHATAVRLEHEKILKRGVQGFAMAQTKLPAGMPSVEVMVKR